LLEADVVGLDIVGLTFGPPGPPPPPQATTHKDNAQTKKYFIITP